MPVSDPAVLSYMAVANLWACWSMKDPVPEAQGPLVLKYSSSHPPVVMTDLKQGPYPGPPC